MICILWKSKISNVCIEQGAISQFLKLVDFCHFSFVWTNEPVKVYSVVVLSTYFLLGEMQQRHHYLGWSSRHDQVPDASRHHYLGWSLKKAPASIHLLLNACVLYITYLEHLQSAYLLIFYSPFLLQLYPPQWASSSFIMLIGIDSKRWRNGSPEKQTGSAMMSSQENRACQKHT